MSESSKVLQVNIRPQPDDVTYRPTCLHALYNYYGDHVEMEEVIAEVQQLKSGGTLAVYLGTHALRRGYDIKIYTYNLHIFDPTWFRKGVKMAEKSNLQIAHKDDQKLQQTSAAYLKYLELGGSIGYA
ncbi:MAG: hypothetical protein ACLFT3_04835 [Cyclobacteriaceae bacterium]